MVIDCMQWQNKREQHYLIAFPTFCYSRQQRSKYHFGLHRDHTQAGCILLYPLIRTIDGKIELPFHCYVATIVTVFSC